MVGFKGRPKGTPLIISGFPKRKIHYANRPEGPGRSSFGRAKRGGR